MATVKQLLNRYKQAELKRQDQNAHRLAQLWRDETYRTYPEDTGAAKRSITAVFKVGPLQYIFSIEVPYAGVIEYGGYPGTGPKVYAFGGDRLSDGTIIEPGLYTTPSAPARRAKARVAKQLKAIVEGDRRTGTVTGFTR